MKYTRFNPPDQWKVSKRKYKWYIRRHGWLYGGEGPYREICEDPEGRVYRIAIHSPFRGGSHLSQSYQIGLFKDEGCDEGDTNIQSWTLDYDDRLGVLNALKWARQAVEQGTFGPEYDELVRKGR